MEVTDNSEWHIRVKNTRNFGPSKHGPQLLDPAISSFQKYAEKHNRDAGAAQSKAATDALPSSPSTVRPVAPEPACVKMQKEGTHRLGSHPVSRCRSLHVHSDSRLILQIGNKDKKPSLTCSPLEASSSLEEAESSSEGSEVLTGGWSDPAPKVSHQISLALVLEQQGDVNL